MMVDLPRPWVAFPNFAAAQQQASDVRATTQRVSIEHVRMTSKRTFAEVKSALEGRLRRYDTRLADMLRQGDVAMS